MGAVTDKGRNQVLNQVILIFKVTFKESSLEVVRVSGNGFWRGGGEVCNGKRGGGVGSVGRGAEGRVAMAGLRGGSLEGVRYLSSAVTRGRP